MAGFKSLVKQTSILKGILSPSIMFLFYYIKKNNWCFLLVALYIVVLKDKSENCVCHLCSLCFICLPIYIFGQSQILTKKTKSKIILFQKIVNHNLIHCWIFIWSLYNLHITFRTGKQFKWLHFPSIIYLILKHTTHPPTRRHSQKSVLAPVAILYEQYSKPFSFKKLIKK